MLSWPKMVPSSWGSEAHNPGHNGDVQGPDRVKEHRGEPSPAGLGTGSDIHGCSSESCDEG